MSMYMNYQYDKPGYMTGVSILEIQTWQVTPSETQWRYTAMKRTRTTEKPQAEVMLKCSDKSCDL